MSDNDKVKVGDQPSATDLCWHPVLCKTNAYVKLARLDWTGLDWTGLANLRASHEPNPCASGCWNVYAILEWPKLKQYIRMLLF